MPAASLLYRTALDLPSANTLVINACSDSALNELRDHAGLTLQQHFKPLYNEIQAQGLEVQWKLPDAAYELILLLPSKNKQQSLGWMARAMQRLSDGGKIIIACANAHGAKSYENALKQLAGTASSNSKAKCRVISARKTNTMDAQLTDQWVNDAKPQLLDSLRMISQPGLFSWDHPDRGSMLLLEQLPALSGTGMDLCSGYGLLSWHLLQKNARIETLHLVEADQFALDCAAENLKAWPQIKMHWLDAACETLPAKLDWIVCNPPFHTGQKRDVELGQNIIQQACKSLKAHGTLWLVANRQLPYEAILQKQLEQVETLIEQDGFKVIKGMKR